MRGMNVRCGRDGLCGERTVREEGAGDARGSGVGAGDDLLGVRGGHPELGHAQVGREGGSGEQHRSPRVGEIIVVDLLGSDLLKRTGGASRGGPLGAEGRLGAARGERGSGLGDDEHDISGPSVGGDVTRRSITRYSKCCAGNSRAFSVSELPSAKHPCIESGNSLFAIQNICDDTKCASACVFRPRLLGQSNFHRRFLFFLIKRPGHPLMRPLNRAPSAACRCTS